MEDEECEYNKAVLHEQDAIIKCLNWEGCKEPGARRLRRQFLFAPQLQNSG
jgi:hypothetical protein